MEPLKVKIVNKSNYSLPTYATLGAAGFDLYANIENPVLLQPLDRYLIPTGIYLSIPLGYEGQVRPRSGLACKHGITVINTPGTCDSDYRGEVKVCLVNLSNEPFVIQPGERIAQMVIAKHEKVSWDKVETIEELGATDRGDHGFGSTGTV